MMSVMLRKFWSALETRINNALGFVCDFHPTCSEHQPAYGYDENSIKGRIGRSLGDLTFV